MIHSTIHAADLFCGCGGASAGLHRAAAKLGAAVDLVAVNHWDTAIATHSANYPNAKHLLTEVEKVSPRAAVPGGRLHLLLAGPSCVHFSQARGGRPVSDQQRSGAWEVIHWARELLIENILVENVPEFLTWGPVDAETGRPCKERKGMYFRQWCRMLTDLGYTVEHRILCSAHFGDATTRRRLFIQARKTGPVTWPKPTHHAPAELASYPGAKPWKSAREIIDWSIPGKSIYNRKRPLAENTIKRIMAGLVKFGGLSFVLGQHSGYVPRSTDDPIPVIATAGKISLVEPFLVILKGTEERQLERTCQSPDAPLPTIHGGLHFGLCEPFIIGGSDASSRRIDDPLRTLTTGGNMALVMPYLVKITQTGSRGAGVYSSDAPVPTLTTQAEHGVAIPYLVRFNGGKGGDKRTESIDAPLSTLDTSNRLAIANPYLVNYYGNGDALSVDSPLDTITTRDRFALIEPYLDKGDKVAVLDIRFRMLVAAELAAAHSFGADYFFAGGSEAKVKQVGNSWTCGLSEALCTEILGNGVGGAKPVNVAPLTETEARALQLLRDRLRAAPRIVETQGRGNVVCECAEAGEPLRGSDCTDAEVAAAVDVLASGGWIEYAPFVQGNVQVKPDAAYAYRAWLRAGGLWDGARGKARLAAQAAQAAQIGYSL